GLDQRDGWVAAGGDAVQREHDLRVVTVEVAGGLGGEHRRRTGVVVVEQARLVDLEVEGAPHGVAGKARGDRGAVVVGATAATTGAWLDRKLGRGADDVRRRLGVDTLRVLADLVEL